MMKTKTLNIAIQSIFVIVFNVFFFSSIETFSLSRWICYGAIHVAYLLVLIACASVSAAKKEGTVHGYPKISLAWTYFIVTLIVSIILIMINNNSPTFPILVQTLVTSFFLMGYMVLMKSEAHSITQSNGEARQFNFIRENQETAKLIMLAAGTGALKKDVEKVYDAIRSAEVISTPAAQEYEPQIQNNLSKLAEAVEAHNCETTQRLIRTLLSLIQKRNAIIRSSR